MQEFGSCQAVLPCECGAPMCSFQSPGVGFFYIPDAAATSNQPKDRATNIVITILDGNPSSRYLEHESTGYLGSGWRCTSRPLNKN
jgi:hypothetical protein